MYIYLLTKAWVLVQVRDSEVYLVRVFKVVSAQENLQPCNSQAESRWSVILVLSRYVYITSRMSVLTNT